MGPSMGAEATLVCYRGACTGPAHPCCYNRVTHGLYCIGCARLINRGSGEMGIGGQLFPMLHLAADLAEGGSWQTGLIRIRPQETER